MSDENQDEDDGLYSAGDQAKQVADSFFALWRDNRLPLPEEGVLSRVRGWLEVEVTRSMQTRDSIIQERAVKRAGRYYLSQITALKLEERRTIALETLAACHKFSTVDYAMRAAPNDHDFEEVALPERDAAMAVLIPAWFKETEK